MSDFQYTRPSNFPPIIKNLLIINGLVYLVQLLFDKQYGISEKIMLWPIMPEKLHAMLVSEGVMSASQGFKPYQIATHMFAHSPTMFIHIIFNMLALWMFGKILENVWGAKRFLLFYIMCGVGAAIFHLAIQYFRCEQLLHAVEADNLDAIRKYRGALSPALGASGAVMGVMVAFAFLFPNTELYLMFLPIPIKAKWAILGYVAIDLFGGINPSQGDNIAHFAHLGGAFTGFIIVYIWNKTNRKTLY
ncbi:MAG: rhomboid family intramembrane serine protease [Chitinophagaceae bacterium]